MENSGGAFNITGIEGIMTNFDLYNLGLQLEIITETVKKKGKGKSIVKRDSRLAELLTKSLDGQAITAVVICLSQSP